MIARPLHMLEGRVAVVTGASSGVGRAIARAYGSAGAKVALIARDHVGLEAAAGEIPEALTFAIDVADAAAVSDAADRIVAHWGQIDIWVNDAMVSVFAPADRIPPEEFRRVIEVNYLGYVHGTLAALRHMKRRDNGVIIQIGSALAYRSIPLQSAYCASKAAIRAFSESVRCELLHDRSNVAITQLHLPAMNTPQFEVVRNRLPGHPKPLGQIYQPEMVARAAVRAALRPTREMWIGWDAVKAILGQRLIPGLLDRHLARTAWDGQTTRELPPGHPVHHADNLDRPMAHDYGVHGIFDAEARTSSVTEWWRSYRGLALAALAVATFAWIRR